MHVSFLNILREISNVYFLRNTHSSLKEVSLSFPGIKTTTSLLGLAHLVKYSKQSSSYKTKSNNPDKSNAIADLIFRCNVSQFSLNILDVLDCQDLRLVSSGIAIKREPEISSLRDADHCTNPSAFFALTSLKLQVANESILSVDDLKLTAHCFSPCLNVPNSISFFVRKFCMVFFPLSIDSAVVILKFMTEVTLLRNIHDQSHHEQNFQDLDSSFNQSSDLVKAQSQNFEFDFFVETLVISLGGNDDHHLLETFVQSVGTRLLYKRNLNFSTNFFVEKIESFYDRGAVLLDIPNVSLQLEASPHHASKFVLEAKSSFDSVNWIIDHDTFSNLLENFKSIDWDQVEQLRIILEKKADGSQQGNKADSSVLIKHVENFKLNIQCKQMKIIIASPGINSRKEHLCLCLRSMNADVTRKSFDEAEFLHYELDGLVSEFLVEHQISGEHFDISADKSESKVPWLVSVPSAHLSLLLLQSKSLALRPSIFKFDCEIPELALNLGITRMCSFYIMKAQFISLVDSFQKLLIKGKGSYMNKHSTDKSDSKLSTEINVHIQSLSLRIETYEDQYLFICSKDIDLHPKTSEIDLFSSSGQMEVLGSTIANWTECKANFVKFNTSLVKHSKDTYCPPPMSFQNIQLEFGVLDVTLNDSVFLGDFIELSLLSLTALQQFDAKLKMSSVKPWSKSPKTLDFGELSLYSKKFSFQLRNDPIESVLLIKRKLSLQQSLREFEDYLSKSYQYAKYIEMHDSHLQFPSFTDVCLFFNSFLSVIL